MQHPRPQQGETCAAIHLSLEVLQPVDLALGLAVAPGQAKGGSHCGDVRLQASTESLQLWHSAGQDLLQPAIEPLGVALTDQAKEFPRHALSDASRTRACMMDSATYDRSDSLGLSGRAGSADESRLGRRFSG